MPLGPRVPPGRTGRLWLAHRLEVARQAASLLDRKQWILRQEHQRLALLVEDSGEEWERTCAEAESWLLRTALLGGQRAVLAGSRDRADTARVQLRWQNTAGVTYPIEALTQAQEAPPLPVAGNAALAYAADSYGRALEAAIHHAAAAVALRLVEDELTVTRQRLRSVEDRWIPQLKSMLADLDLRLAELEREEIIRLRWAHAQHRGPVGRR